MKSLPPIVAVPVKFGLVGGAMTILLFLVIYFLGQNPLLVYGNFDFSFLLLPVFIFFSIKEFRDYKNHKQLGFWQSMAVGIISYVTMALISAFFIWFFLNFINSELVSGYIADRIQLIVHMKGELIEKLGTEMYEKTYHELESTTAYVIALDDFLKKIFIGLFLTLILSVILRK